MVLISDGDSQGKEVRLDKKNPIWDCSRSYKMPDKKLIK